jgi:hypothetical protein
MEIRSPLSSRVSHGTAKDRAKRHHPARLIAKRQTINLAP